MAKLDFPLVQVKDPTNSGGFHNWPAVYPGPSMSWSNAGDTKVNGNIWKGDTTISASGDPTSSDGARLGINTGANHDANTRWE